MQIKLTDPFFALQADATLEMEQRHFCQASLEYVFLLQEVQERKKFEFVETVCNTLVNKVLPEWFSVNSWVSLYFYFGLL